MPAASIVMALVLGAVVWIHRDALTALGAAGGALALMRTITELTRDAAHRPRPQVSLLQGDEVVQCVRVGHGRFRSLDIDAIVAFEIEAARATEPSADWVDMGWRDDGQGRPSPTSDDVTWRHGQPIDPENWAATLEAAEGWRRHIEPDERVEFDAEMEEHASALEEWLYNLEDEREDLRRRLPLGLRLGNTGGEPALDVTLTLRLPGGFEPVGRWDSLGPEPVRPRFEKGPHDAFMNHLEYARRRPREIPASLRPRPDPPPTVGPRYEDTKEGWVVTHRLSVVPHGLPVDVAEAAVLRVLVPGIHHIRWELHASNLPRPASGSLTIDVGPLDYEDPPIADLDVAQRALLLTGRHEIHPDPSDEEVSADRAALDALAAPTARDIASPGVEKA
jgi:hypothetical protein